MSAGFAVPSAMLLRSATIPGDLTDGDRRYRIDEGCRTGETVGLHQRVADHQIARHARDRRKPEYLAVLRRRHAGSPRERSDRVAARPFHIGRRPVQHRGLAGRAARAGHEMAGGLQPVDPIIDITNMADIDARDRMRGHRFQPLAQPIPFPLRQPTLGIALVRGVGEQQRHDVRQFANLGDAAGLGAVSQQADPADAILQQLIGRGELHRQ